MSTANWETFVLEQHELYGVLTNRVREIRERLDDGESLAHVLTTETDTLLWSPMTRPQIASSLVSLMARIAQGEDLLTHPTDAKED